MFDFPMLFSITKIPMLIYPSSTASLFYQEVPSPFGSLTAFLLSIGIKYRLSIAPCLSCRIGTLLI